MVIVQLTRNEQKQSFLLKFIPNRQTFKNIFVIPTQYSLLFKAQFHSYFFDKSVILLKPFVIYRMSKN